MTTRERTLRDVLASLPEVDAVRWFELNRRLVPEQVQDLAGRLPGRGTSKARRRMALADPLSESWLETCFRLLLVARGIKGAVPQHRLRDDRGEHVARFDFAWLKLKVAVELDGKKFHGGPDAKHRDRRRDNRSGAAGWVILRFTYADVVHGPVEVIAQLVAALRSAA